MTCTYLGRDATFRRYCRYLRVSSISGPTGGGTLETRLKPINALVGLTIRGDLNPPILADAGFELAGLEVPARGGGENPRTVVIDAVLHRPTDGLIIACECKSGANVEAVQASTYGTLKSEEVVLGASITLRSKKQPRLETLYVALEKHTNRIRQGLDALELNWPILRVGEGALTLDFTPTCNTEFQQVWPSTSVNLVAPVASHIPFDEYSPLEAVKGAIMAVLIQTMTHRKPYISVESICSQAAPHWIIYGKQRKGELLRIVEEACRSLSESELKEKIFFERRSERRQESLVRILETPESLDPRGRTQRYQAIARMTGRSRRPPRPALEGQYYLFDQLGEADDEVAEGEGDE